ncbi:hypothetical protein OHU10_33885 [Streptomyces europaeiscabiei]|nr:hypothetical protein [Streptomyces europaeiscabiei]
MGKHRTSRTTGTASP